MTRSGLPDPQMLERLRVEVPAQAVPKPRRRPAPKRNPLSFRRRLWVPLLLYLGDVATLEGSLCLGRFVRELSGPALKRGQFEAMALLMFVLPLAFVVAGLYPGYGLSVVERLRRRVYTVSLVFGMLILCDYLVAEWYTSRGVLLLTFGFAVTAGPIIDAAVRRVLLACRCWGTPTVVLGAGETGDLLVRILRQEPELGLVPIGLFDDDPEKWTRQIDGVPVLGPLSNAKSLAGSARIALIATPGLPAARQARLCSRLPFHRVILIPDLMGIASLWVQSRDLGGVVGLEVTKNLFRRRNWVLKRTMDYVLGVPLFLVSLPLLGLLALWIKAVSRGPALYSQSRVGFGGRTIVVWKLRTMYPDADQRLHDHLDADPEAFAQWKRCFKLKDDPRVLPGVGRFLRRTSLDELPQVWNVLRGQMSLVGPRPFPHYHLSRFQGEFRALRRTVLPGLTGLWQVSARSDGDTSVQEVLDTYYIRNWSPWLDIYLLARTVGAVVLGRGAY